MKKLSIILILLGFATAAQAQFVIDPFDTLATGTFFNYPVPGNLHNLGTGTGFVKITNDATIKHGGAASLKEEWTVNTTESWGGYVQMLHLLPTSGPHTYLDWSMADHISIWYNNTTASSKPGGVHMRFKIHEAGGESTYWTSQSDHEDWYFETAVPYDATPGWKELIVPLKTIDGFDGAAPNDQGFSLPGWSGTRNNGTLDLDKVVGFSIECTAPVLAPDNMASGVIYWDDLTLQGAKYPVFCNFDNTATGYFTIDNMSWDAGNKGKITLTDITTKPFEGVSSLQIDYTVNATQSWGGYANMEHIFTTPLNISTNTALYCAIKNLVPNNLTGRLQCRFILYDDSGAKRESWFTLFNINIDKASDWTTIAIPLTKTEASSWDLKPGVFINPPGQGNDDGVFTLTKIAGFKIEFSVSGSDKGPTGPTVLSQGSMLIDFLVRAGFQETDKTAPNPPTSVTATAGAYTNLVTWKDVPNLSGETYNVYFSKSPITDVNAKGVDVVKLGIPHGVQVAEHALRYPAKDYNVSYYYAITCKKKNNGMFSTAASTASATSNAAQGVPIISLVVPTNFKADGNLSEWTSAGIKPFSMIPSKGAFFAPNGTNNGDADLSVLAYLAIDQNYLYAAFDVTDNAVYGDWQKLGIASYLADSPDLFLGMYNYHGAPHTSYQRGAQPDYHLRFNQKYLRSEGGADIDSLMKPGANYYWAEATFPKQGYVVEAKIPLKDMMTMRNSSTAATDQFYLKEGYRIPIDFSINDNDDGKTRKAIMTYSKDNQDQSWADVSRWSYTWIGEITDPATDVKETGKPTEFTLSQNYPNPFNPTTQIKYSLSKAGNVNLKIYDVLGRLVSELVNKEQGAGSYTVQFDASKLSSGVYFYKLESGSFVSVKKMMLVK